RLRCLIADQPFSIEESLAINVTISLGTASLKPTDDGKGVKVLEVDDESNAGKAGIKEDDIITHVNDKEVNSTDEITKAVREARDKSSMMLRVLRNGKTKNIEVRTPRRLKTTDL
ncbi:MAG: PDZ domain-containing protein, partial [Nitrososphaera sp.]|nr:PDZ domain-containing protein [Nitrososphaera sp.]